jgi:hypothetical protein
MIRIRQRFEAPVVDDVAGEIEGQIEALRLEREVAPGQSVAVACSSAAASRTTRKSPPTSSPA